ncbi:TPA: hypothetical protein DIC20_05105 [Candidatus Dependentiae bacterium]|nr:hypothetical protein [Candidatus Dependentiae bacterium]HCU01049.1 hypothetical protein [Candidatus Dependentiae bacterium]
MKHKFNYLIFFLILILLPACKLFEKKEKRETIFDKKVSIPKQLVLEIPEVPSLCDEIPDLKKGFVDIPGGKLYYEEEGSGNPLVLVNPGPGGTHHAFHPYFSQLKDIARIIYYDARGTGKSTFDETGKTYTMKQLVEDLEYLRKGLNIETWVMLGWSFGGFSAQCYALTHPETLRGLILVAPGYGKTSLPLKPSRCKNFLTAEEKNAIQKINQMKVEGKLTELQASINAYLAGEWKCQYYYKPTLAELYREDAYFWKPAPGFNRLMSLDRSQIDLEGKFDDFEIPTLLIEGKWDLSWDTDKFDYMQKLLPHAQFELFENSSHCVFCDETKKFFEVLRTFLKNLSEKPIEQKKITIKWPKPPVP